MSTSLSRHIHRLILEEIGQHSRVSLSDYLSLRFKGARIKNLSIPADLNSRQRWLLDQLITIVNELRSNNIDSQEYLNSDNLGFKKDGSLGLFDMGFGDYLSTGSPGDETISLEGGEGTLLGQILSRLGVEKAISQYIIPCELKQYDHIGFEVSANNPSQIFDMDYGIDLNLPDEYFGFWEKFEDSGKSALVIKGTNKKWTIITDVGNVIPRTDLAMEFYKTES